MPHGSYKRSNQSITRVKGQLDTLFEVHCPVNGTEIYEAAIMLLPPGESSIIGCTVSVSNDGINFGDQVELYLYDSACLRPIKSNDKYKFELQVSPRLFSCLEVLSVSNGRKRRTYKAKGFVLVVILGVKVVHT